MNDWILLLPEFLLTFNLIIWKPDISLTPHTNTHLFFCCCMPSAGSVDLLDSQKTQARHYKTLQEMYKSKKPNKAAVTHLLDLEFESRRRFITSDILKEQDRPTKILEAYPCFREVDHVSKCLPLVASPHIFSSSQYTFGGILASFSYSLDIRGLCLTRTSNGDYFVSLNFLSVFECTRYWMSCGELSNQPIPGTSQRWRTDGKASTQRSSFMVLWRKPWSLQKLWMEVRSQYFNLPKFIFEIYSWVVI